MARALCAYAASRWRCEQHFAVLPGAVSRRHQAQHAVLRANNGKTLSWRRIVEITSTARNAAAVHQRDAESETAGALADGPRPRLGGGLARAEGAETSISRTSAPPPTRPRQVTRGCTGEFATRAGQKAAGRRPHRRN